MSPKVQRLVKLLSRLPGVGEKTAQRYVLWLLTADDSLARSLGAELAVLRDEVGPCERCGNVAEIRYGRALCDVCTDGKRDAKLLCVVARVHDLMAIERAGSMRGRYFVLGKLLSPLEGIGPEDLPLGRLTERIRGDGVTEVIVATPPSVDGEATALLLKRELAPLGVAVTRIASGVPHGGDLEFADPITMGRALAGRQRL
ncbi:MAG TPA: recombination mediator RecR [Polyangiaceae bacterium]|nr:recombination mediator RecR [Polyangiaceae bacterium]